MRASKTLSTNLCAAHFCWLSSDDIYSAIMVLESVLDKGWKLIKFPFRTTDTIFPMD